MSWSKKARTWFINDSMNLNAISLSKRGRSAAVNFDYFVSLLCGIGPSTSNKPSVVSFVL